MYLRLINIYFACLLLSCNQQPLDLERKVRPVLRAHWDSFIVSWENEDAAQCASLYLEDGKNIPPQLKENNGRLETQKFYEFLFKNNISSKYQHEIISLDGNNNNVIERGRFQVDWVRNDSTTWTFYGRTLTHWVKNNNDWKIKTFLFNNPPE